MGPPLWFKFLFKRSFDLLLDYSSDVLALVSKKFFGKVTLVTNRGSSGGLGEVWRRFGFWYKETYDTGSKCSESDKNSPSGFGEGSLQCL